MFTRTLVALLVLSSGNVFSQQPTVFSRQKQTGVIKLKMSGDLAREYAQISGAIDGLSGHSISATAFIAKRLENDQVRIEHSAHVTREGKTDRLVTLTATVDETAIRSLVRTMFDGDFTFSDSPARKEAGESPTVSARHLAVPFLSLADLNGIKLRTWTLESELGE